MNSGKERDIQQQYYRETATNYDLAHLNQCDEHYFSLCFLISILDFYGIRSILDVGSGTGRVVAHVKGERPDLTIVGLEPVQELRAIGYSKGLTENELVEGDGTALPFRNGEFDMVCSFGVLHHVRTPDVVVAEMLRVAKTAVFISDANNFGQGTKLSRFLKQCLNGVGLWGLANYVKTGGKGYSISEGDGLAYSYSVFNNYPMIEKQCEKVHLLNTQGSGVNFYRSVGHLALLGVKRQCSE